LYFGEKGKNNTPCPKKRREYWVMCALPLLRSGRAWCTNIIVRNNTVKDTLVVLLYLVPLMKNLKQKVANLMKNIYAVAYNQTKLHTMEVVFKRKLSVVSQLSNK
jgi:hypothetical protein